jgi:hypothetical protein
MKKILILTFLFPLILMAQTKKPVLNNVNTNQGHAIQISLKPFQNTKIYLGTNYGNNKVFADSCILNEKSEGVFQSKTKLTPGIYFIVSPKLSILFDLLIDEKQTFSISADTLNLNNIKITGSKDNELFQNYSKIINDLFIELNKIEQKYKTALTTADSANYKEAYTIKDKEIKQKRKSFIDANPNSLMRFLLQTMEMPEVPAIPIVNGKPDSLYPYRYVKTHYWDNILFNDNRLLRTPFFENKLDKNGEPKKTREPSKYNISATFCPKSIKFIWGNS